MLHFLRNHLYRMKLNGKISYIQKRQNQIIEMDTKPKYNMALSHILSPSLTKQKIAAMNPFMNTYENANNHDQLDQVNEQRCFGCQSSALVTDWKQGDIVCTNCGIVNEDRIRETGQEWTVRNSFH